MTRSIRPIAVLAIGLSSIAGCGGGDQSPHPVDQGPSPVSQPASPGEVGLSDRLPAEQTTSPQPPDLLDQQGTARRGFWTGGRPRKPFGEWTMRQTAIDALTRIGESAVPALVNLLDDPDAKLRSEAVIALARIGPEARGALPRLIALVENDPDEAVRKNAVRAIGQIGPAAAPAVPVLVEQLRAEVEIPAGNEHPAGSTPSRGRGRPGDRTEPTDQH